MKIGIQNIYLYLNKPLSRLNKPLCMCSFVFLCVISYTIEAQSIINKNAFTTLKILNEKAINTPNLESSPCFFGGKVAFVYANNKTKFFDTDLDESFYEIGYANVDFDNKLIDKVAFSNRINSDYHEGPMAYDLNNNRLYLTRTFKSTKKLKSDQQDTFYLRILAADLNKDKPTAEPINLNVANHSVCHPTLTADGRTMVFASNQPGGVGKMDLYIAYFDGTNWTSVMPVGKKINTINNEVFPTILNDSILVFASDRPGGLGGLDLWASKLKNGDWSVPELLPAPLNSSYDDLGLVVRTNGRSGYFASNRLGGIGKDDIYSFSSEESIFDAIRGSAIMAEVTVLDKLTLNPVSNAKIVFTPLAIDVNDFNLSSYNIDMLSGYNPGDLILKLSPKKDKALPSVLSDDMGLGVIEVHSSQKYIISVKAEGYDESFLIYDYAAYSNKFNLVVEPEEVVEGDLEVVLTQAIDDVVEVDLSNAIGNSIVFENIYFEYNSYRLKATDNNELEGLASFLVKNPTLSVRLESHTDSRGNADYNMQLSIERAESIRDFLKGKGLDSSKIVIKGYGETKIRNICKDGIPCTEEQHRRNRRTEVMIIKDF